MAEIKSAIELAMERTKDLIADRSERDAMALKEAEARVRAVVRRYMEEMIKDGDVAKELGRVEVDSRLKRSILSEVLAEEFDVKKDNTRLMAVFRLAGLELKESLQSELELMQDSLNKAMRKEEAVIHGKVWERLERMGITGDGIEPNLEAWDEWKEGLEALGKTFRNRMEVWKDKVKELNGA
jgi:hypothetical protein